VETHGRRCSTPRAFAAQSHPHAAFPHLGADALCALCQQPLGDSVDRLVAFDVFVNAEAEKSARARREKAADAFRALTQTDLSIGLDEALREELRTLDDSLPGQFDVFAETMKKRVSNIKSACSPGGDWSTVAALPADPGAQLSALVEGHRNA
jgi:hypothetical protein